MKIVHCKKEKYDVLIDRTTNWGNPFVLGKDGGRQEVINKFALWLKFGETFQNQNATEERRDWILLNLKNLKGKTLACWCAPQDCHGSILIELCNTISARSA